MLIEHGIGFSVLMNFCNSILKLDYQTFLFLVSFFTNVLFYYYIKKATSNPGLALVLFVSCGFYTSSFNIFRQMLCMSIMLFAFLLWKDKKFLRAILLWLIAISFHSSSIVAIAAFVIFNIIKNHRVKIAYLLPFPILGVLLYDLIFYIVVSAISSYSMYATYNGIPGVGTFLNVLVYLLVTAFLIVPRFKPENKNFVEYNMFLIGIIIMIMELRNWVFFRLAFYFTILLIVVLPQCIRFNKESIKMRVLEKIVLYTSLFAYYIVYIISFDNVVPYKFFFIK